MREGDRHPAPLRTAAIFLVGSLLSILTNVLTNLIALDSGWAWVKWPILVAVVGLTLLGGVLSWRHEPAQGTSLATDRPLVVLRTVETDAVFVTNIYGAQAQERILSSRQRWSLAVASATMAAGFAAIGVLWPDASRGGGIAVWMVVTVLGTVAVVAVPWFQLFGRTAAAGPNRLYGISNRRMVLGKVARLWIEQALHRSLQHVVKMEVNLDQQPDVIADPWAGARLERLGEADALPDGTRLSHLYGRRDVRRVVVIGAPGSGKTTHLLEFAEDLVHRAEADDAAPIPVVLRLSEWSGRQRDLANWIVAEFGARYEVPADEARDWLRSGDVVVLLDGLDEVAAHRRQRCVAALDEFCRDHRYAAGLVVTCRTSDYEMLHRRLPVDLGLRVRPLPVGQVLGVLDAIGPDVAALKSEMARNDDLSDLLTTPLMLGVAVLATRRLPVGTPIPADTMYSLYVRRMLSRQRMLRGIPAGAIIRPFTDPETYRYLVWLARLMNLQGRTAFYPDWVTPAWLPDRKPPWPLPRRPGLLARVARRLGWDHTSTAAVGGAYAALFAAYAGAPLGAQVGGWWGVLIWSAIAAAVTCTMVAVIFGLLLQLPRAERYLTVALGREGEAVYSAASWSWSARRAAKGALVATIPGAVVVLIGTPFSTVLQRACVFAVILVGGALSGGNVPNHREPPVSPGRALSASLRRLAVLIGVLTAIILVAAVVCAILGGPWATIVASLPLTAGVMLLSGPGRAWLRNRAAYFGLQHAGLMPRHLFAFLIHADERILMRRAGGGFEFLHRTLQDFLAGQDPENYHDDAATRTELSG